MGWLIFGLWFVFMAIYVSVPDSSPALAWLSVIIAVAIYIAAYFIREHWRIKTGKIWRTSGPAVEFTDISVGHLYDSYSPHWVIGSPDSAGGWDVQFTLQNVGSKIINYVYIYLYPIDRVGYRCAPTERVQYTGPISPPEIRKALQVRHKWYGEAVGNVVMEKVIVVFADGSQQTIMFTSDRKPYVADDKVMAASKENINPAIAANDKTPASNVNTAQVSPNNSDYNDTSNQYAFYMMIDEVKPNLEHPGLLFEIKGKVFRGDIYGQQVVTVRSHLTEETAKFKVAGQGLKGKAGERTRLNIYGTQGGKLNITVGDSLYI